MQYIVMDMEWNNAYSKKLGAFVNEIIEIGAVKLDDSLRVLDTFSVIIKSKIGKKLRGRVKTLTHLTNEDISNGIPFEDAFSQFENWVGPEDNVFLTWGDGDIRTLVKNCEYFLNGKKPLFIRHFADLQKYCQSYTDAAASGQQLGLSAAAEKLGIDPEAFPHHRALDDSKLSVVCLQKVYEPEKMKKFATACDGVFYEKLAFKPFYISDLHSSLLDPKWFDCVCDVCGGKVKREKKWKSVNRSFRGEFYCKNCDRHFRVTIRCKQFYDRLDVRKTFKEILPEEKNPVPIPVRTEKSEA